MSRAGAAQRAAPLLVQDASSGATHRVELVLPGTVVVVMEALLRLTGLALKDQILLYGPPFKQLSSKRTLRDILTDREGNAAFEIFLFNKRSLFRSAHVSESGAGAAGGAGAPAPPLEPIEVLVPTSPTGHEPSVLAAQLEQLEAASSPLGRALIDYERQFRLHKAQADALRSGARARLASCRACVAQQLVQIRAMGAATSNLQHHLSATSATCEAFAAAFAAQRGAQQRILTSFDSNLELLRTIDVHPAIWAAHTSAAAAAAAAQAAQAEEGGVQSGGDHSADGGGDGDASSSRSLLATLPIDRLKLWHAECTRSHQQVSVFYLYRYISMRILLIICDSSPP